MRQKICFYRLFASLLNVFLLISISFITFNILWVEANDDSKDDQNWNTIFTLRSDDDWRQLWHSEKHKRCYQDLVDHMGWVCDKDIYKIRSKRHLIEDAYTTEPFLSAQEANMFGILRAKKSSNRRISKRGIIDECCNGAAGCSWEEYAEYCPANRRNRI